MIKEQYNDEIVSLSDSKTSYIDQAYYNKNLEEKRDKEEFPDYKNFPVKV